MNATRTIMSARSLPRSALLVWWTPLVADSQASVVVTVQELIQRDHRLTVTAGTEVGLLIAAMFMTFAVSVIRDARRHLRPVAVG
jgi:hypothetical protein